VNAPETPQVAWKAIQEGAEVFSSEAEAVARVSRVVGDADADVFTGLAVKLGALGSERFVPSERVTAIWPDRVDVDLPSAAIEELPEYEEAPAVRWQADTRGFFRRLFGRR
jgi:HEAT repeat protein